MAMNDRFDNKTPDRFESKLTRRGLLLGTTAIAAATGLTAGAAKADMKEYKPGQAFSGVVGRTFDVSKPAWPVPVRARDGAPNVLFIILDDTGFGQLGC